MKRLLGMAFAAGTLLTAACSSDNSIVPGSCSLTLSGAVTGTASCQIAAATTASTGGKVSFGLEGQSGGTTFTFAAVLNETTFQTGTYGSSTGTSVVQAGGSASTSAGASWLQFNNTNGVNDQGSFVLTITSTGGSVPSGGYTGWPDPGGSLSVTLTAVPASGASGTVTGQANF